jgi:hypothetical protein
VAAQTKRLAVVAEVVVAVFVKIGIDMSGAIGDIISIGVG